MNQNVDVAIIGMSCIFPGAGDVAAFWKNIINRVDAIQRVPENRLDSVFFDGETAVDRFYCRRGGFIDEFAAFDPIQFGILPLVVESTEPEQLLALSLAHKALMDAGVFEKELPLDNTGIIIGKGNYPGPGAVRGIEIIRTGEQIVRVLQHLLPDLKKEELDRVKKEFQVKKGRFGPDTAMGLIPNLVASLVANRLNLGGTAYTIDAACASSLIAVDHAIQELSSRRSDMVIAGGVHASQNAPFWSIFTQLGALSRNEQIRPFDQRADGVLIGEGCGFVVLKRLDDAIRDGHRIYAVVKGVGVSSDGAGVSVMSPSVKGQTKAILQAWQRAGTDLREIGYLEAHGTATQLGDRTELETLLQVFGSDPSLPKAGIGTIKSMIGHAMPAAGMAGLIKTALALYHGQLPPTLHCEEPLPLMQKTRFEPVQEAVSWEASGLPRRAGVNAFGFGGINAHVVLEGFEEPAGARKKQFNGNSPVSVKRDPVLLLARPDKASLIKALEESSPLTGEGDYRIALFDPTPERIKKAIKIVEKDKPWRNKQDIWFTNDPLLLQGGKVAFLFPGLDGLVNGETASVARYFNLPGLPYIAGAEGVLAAAQQQMENSGILDAALKQLGVQPDLNAGHSLGEWLAGRAAGMVEEHSLLRLQAQLDPALFEQKNATFLVAGCGYDKLKPLLDVTKDLYLSIDNCPQQVILCGTNEAVEKFTATLREEQIFHQVLTFQSGFHSPFVKDKLDLLLKGMDLLQFRPATVPVWSATTLSTYPADVEAIRQLSVEHLVEPVRFRELTEKLYHEGVRVFIQVGAGGLVGFVDDTLKQQTYSAVAASVPVRSGLCQLQRVLAALFVEGRAVNNAFMDAGAVKSKTASAPVRLQLGSPIVKELATLKQLHVSKPVHGHVPETAGSPVMQALLDNFAEISNIQHSVMEIFQQKTTYRNGANGHHTAVQEPPSAAAPPKKQPVIKPLDISLDTHPYLIDHSLIRQRPGWHCADDMEPVIPMTMILEVFGDIAREYGAGLLVQKIMNVKVFQWMNVAAPFRETVFGDWKTADRLYLNLEKYANAEVQLAKQYNMPDRNSAAIGAPLSIAITPEQIYTQRMFHGPAYQGIKAVTVIAEKGITGIIEGGAGKGSLLDNAGQLFGLWLQLTLPKDRIAFPVKIQEVELYAPLEDQQGSFECTCQLMSLNDEFAVADFILKRNNQVWAIIRGWQNRRLELDERLWNALISPAHALSTEIVPGVFMFHNAYTRVNSWDFIVKRYFNQAEKKHHSALPIHKKKEWVISRVAAKDAVKAMLFRSGETLHYPVEFAIASSEAGQPFPEGGNTGGIHISIAHKNTDAVAIARHGRPVGIDIEEIREHNTAFKELVFHPAELALIGAGDEAEWLTRYWVAKEAYGKCLGVGLQGNPKAYAVEEINGEDLRIKDIIIHTIKYKNYIIGWTS